MMPDMGALSNMAGSMHRMGLSQQQRQVNLLAAKLGVEAKTGDDKMSPEQLSNSMI